MKTTTFGLFLACLLFGAQGIAQKNNEPKFGTLTAEAFQDTYEDLDADPHAVVIYDKGNSEFVYSSNRGFEIESTYHVRVHILKKSELSRGNLTLSYYKGTSTTGDKIFRIKAATYNLENGKVVKSEMSKKAVFDEDVDDNYAEMKFSLPDVKEGSIIEYTYTKRSTLNHSSNPSTWYFQSDIPVRWSELNIEIPGYFYYQIIMGGYLPLAFNDQKPVNTTVQGTGLKVNAIQYKFVVKDAPAFKNESFITTSNDYISKIEFELSSVDIPGQPLKNYNTTWDELDETLMKSDYWIQYLSGKADLQEMAEPFKKIEDEKERAQAIYDYMIATYQWNDYVGVWSGGKIKDVLKEKKGTASALNLLALGLFQAAGLDAHPVIISTRRNGRINTIYPLLDRFNYTIVSLRIGIDKLFIDVTDPLLPMGTLPNRCLSAQGREIKRGKGEFVDIKTKGKFSELEEVEASFDLENASLIGNYKNSSDGYAAKRIRDNVKELGEDGYREGITKTFADWEIDNFTLNSIQNVYSPAINSFSFVKEDGGIMEDMIYLNPMVFGQISENPFKSKTRDFPVDFAHLTTHNYSISLEIPEGFEAEEMPEPIHLKLPNNGGRFIYSCSISEGKVKVISNITLKKAVFPANDYVLLKEFYDRIVSKHAEQIVLSKNE
ncbi:DUF3857 domain-containing protein [Arcticibacterium luteifluviistationis]|uniref:Uncharacterized protein n=1 Tax=Arcticibacterium luteifluviistationis TaxID=1784714 RepID=A0A2Z4GA44_9BACT|nr:DUF3857 domain-containing protein [Arcticibacterium luteifluviistationis]AWV98066.1 hypothetical protein DJ013_07725 [Arcticibacterium luteifluviistationis]